MELACVVVTVGTGSWVLVGTLRQAVVWQERAPAPFRLGEVELTVTDSSSLALCAQNHFFVSAVIVPEKALKLMRDGKEWGSDPRSKQFKSVRVLVF